MNRHSRLLFAAARGARTQFWCIEGRGYWQDADLRNCLRWDAIRIHPEDAHLQYGPISTELRDAAALPEIRWLQDVLSEYGKAVIEDYTNDVELGYAWHTASEANYDHKQIFLLFLAEIIADSGL